MAREAPSAEKTSLTYSNLERPGSAPEHVGDSSGPPFRAADP